MPIIISVAATNCSQPFLQSRPCRGQFVQSKQAALYPSSMSACTYCKDIWVTSTVFSHLSCMPVVYVTCHIVHKFRGCFQVESKGAVEKLPPFVKLVSPFKMHINPHFLSGLVFLCILWWSSLVAWLW